MKGLSHVLFMSILAAKISSAATLVEDFSTLDHADPSNSTGVWNIVTREARARAYANGATESTRPIDFGNGSDGVVNSSAGYHFNTDTHPNGYQFQSLSITSGTVTVTGSRPLVIRSLSGVTITPAIQVNGGRGVNGVLNGAATAGGNAITCRAKGGSGGASTPTNGGDAIDSSGGTEANTHGRTVAGSTDAIPATVNTGPTNINFDTDPASDFVCGTSGGGGGGYDDGTSRASGGGGGAGGGVIQLVAVGDIQVGTVEAKGGDGGNGVSLSGSCSGNGMGGCGGVIFFQSLGNVTAGTNPDVSGGNSGTACGTNIQVVYGYTRADRSSANTAPAWADGSYTTDEVPPSLQSYVQSKAYDLGVLNASFTGDTVTSTGSVTMTYAGSSDGLSFSAFSPLDQMSDRGYRYVKFRATFTNPASGNVAPKITGLTLQYQDLGLAKLDGKLFAGCGTLAAVGRKTPSSPGSDQAGLLFTLFAILACYGMSRLRV